MVDNAIIIENLKPGTPKSVWDAAATRQIEGFATDISYNHGSDVSFKINLNVAPTATAQYHIEIYRLGYYGGDGATLVTTLGGLTGIAQPDPITDARGVVDAGNWSVSATWHSPGDAVSGIYLAKLVRDDNGGTNQIPFIIRNDTSHSDIVLQTSDTTWQAYNGWAGRNGEVGGSLYGGFTQPSNIAPDVSPECDGACLSCTCGYNRAFGVSYDRPIITRDGGGVYAGAQDYVFGADYAAVSFLEKHGYDVSYISGVDTDRLGSAALMQHKAYISVGHDEYWSGDQRANVEAARDAGVNLLFWSGNEVYWKTRWEPSIVDGKPDRTLITYKETKFNFTEDATAPDYPNIDPSNEWTGTWRDTRFVDAVGPDGVTHIAAGARPENSLTGQLFGPDGTGEFGGALDVPTNYAGLRVWRDTSVASGGAQNLAPGIIGYEWDVSPDDASRPAGLIKLSETTISWGAILTDQGNRTAPGEATHTLTLYRAPSGALVFGAGTVFWSWGLSDEHDSSPYGANIESTALKQFTLNLLADMGIQPGVTDTFLQAEGLVRASASSDHVAAFAALTAAPDSTPALAGVVLRGTATDNDGDVATVDGRVAVVEVSVDGGNTWRVAEGSSNWNFNWLPTTPGVYTVMARAIDDSLNTPTASHIATRSITVTAAERPSEFSLFGPSVTPTGTLYDDGQALELGMKFQVAEAGTITALRYFRAAGDAADTDVRAGHLWSPNGTLLGTVTFTSAPGQSGWQVATLTTPVAVQAGVTYIVSYHTADNYLAAGNYFGSAVSDPFNELTAPASGASGGNGLYAYSAVPVAPDQTFGAANYWADVVFAPANAAPATPDLTAASDSGASNSDNVTNDNTPTLVGTAPAGATVRLYDDTTQIGSAIADGSGAWSIVAPVLADGIHLLTARVVTSGVPGPASNALTVEVDTTAPFAPTTPNITPDSDNGASGSDGVTSITTPTFVGMAAAEEGGRASPNEAGGTSAHETGGTVTLYDGAVVLGSSPIDGVGHWSVTTTPLGLGAHAIAARVTDIAGNVGPLSAARPITIVAGPPAVPSAPDLLASSDTGALSTDNLTNDNTPTLTGTALAGSTVSLYDGATVVGSATADAGGTWSITASALTDGAHVLTATAATAGGTSPASAALTVTIDTTPPVAPAAPDMTTASDDGASGSDNATSIVTPTFSVTVANETSGSVTLYDGATAIGTSGGFSGGSWLVTSSALSPGAHAITARATDAAGNVGPASAALPVTIVAPPSTFSLFGPAVTPTGTVYSDGQEVELGVKFQAAGAGNITALRYFRDTVDSADTDVRAGHLWSATGNLLGTVTFTSAPGQSGWQVATLTTPVAVQAGVTYIVSYHTADNYLAAGNYFGSAVSGPGGMLTAPSAADAGGNGVYRYGSGLGVPNQTYNAANYWADVVFAPGAPGAPPAPPAPDLVAASDTGVSSTDNLTNDTTPTLVGTAAAGAVVTLYDGATSAGSATADAGGNWSITTPAMANGSHVLTATATTANGTSAASPSLTITIDSAAPAAPTTPDMTAASDNGASSTDNATSVTTPTFAGTLVGEVGATVTLYEGATVLGSAVVDGSGNWSITSSALSLGAHTITARAVDRSGNAGATSAGLPVTIVSAATPPAAPSTPDLTAATDTGASSTDNITNDTTPTLAGSAVAGATVTLYDGATAVGTGVADAGGAWSITTAALASGGHTLTARASNANGTSSSSGGLVVTIDTTAPGAPSTPDMTAASDNGASSTDNTTSITTPTFAGTLTGGAGATVTLYEGATALGSAVVNAAGAWSVTSAALSLGAHTITARAVDVAGNIGALSAALPVNIVVEGGQTLSGTGLANTLSGGAGNDSLSGLGGNDQLNGNGGADTLDGGSGNDVISGGEGDDRFIVRSTQAQSDTMAGGNGNDTLQVDAAGGALTLTGTTNISGFEIFDGSGQVVQGNANANVLDFSGFATVVGVPSIAGLGGADTLTGNGGANTLDGGTSNDQINGGGGNDLVIGGSGADSLTGGAGDDIFRYTALSESTSTTRDVILDFQGAGVAGGDVIDVSALSGTYVFRGTSGFLGGGTPSVRYVVSGGVTDVQFDSGNGGSAEMVIRVNAASVFTSGDFIL